MYRAALISLSERCSLGCTFCFRADVGATSMSIAVYLRTLSRLRELGIKTICLTGGEPTEHSSFLKFVKIAHQFGLTPSLVTAAPNVDSIEKISKISHLLAHLTLSIDSKEASLLGKTSRSLARANLLLSVLDRKCDLTINFTFYKVSLEEASTLCNFCKKAKCAIDLTPVLLSSAQQSKFAGGSVEYLSEIEQSCLNLSKFFYVPLQIRHDSIKAVFDSCDRHDLHSCKSKKLFVSPRGAIRLCPFGLDLATVYDAREQLRYSVHSPAVFSAQVKNFRCSLFCHS
jgi:molybdenum cofactor biosynthesis enzyme MoaA